MRFTPEKPAIHGETLQSLGDKLGKRGDKPFRARQVMEWLYKKKADAFADMTNLPSSLRQWLEETYSLRAVTPVLVKESRDVTEKLLLRLEDGHLIETVIIRAPQAGVGPEMSRKTICISTQVGCAYGCRFCASGLDGWKRDLSSGEIVGQLMEVCRREETAGTLPASGKLAAFDNIVVMGMGEPLANYDNLLRALNILNADWGLRFGARRITLSTSGLVPQILRLADEPMAFRLAVSLHGATNEVRNEIMPVNRRYPLEQLIPAVAAFAARHRRMTTLEFILIEDVNDSLEQARELRRIARELHAHVNLIPYNSVEGLPWKRPGLKRQETFTKVLRDAGVSVTLRREKGHDIDAACGQLRLRELKNPA